MSNIDLNDTGQGLGENTEPGALANLGADEQDIILAAEGAGEKRRRSGPLIVIGVVVLAAASLFSMRTLTKVTAKGVRTNDIDKIVDGYLKTPADGTDESAKTLIAQLTDVKPVDRPLPRGIFSTDKGDPGEPKPGPAPTQEGPWRTQCTRAADKLKVTSVMRDLLASINKKIVQLGGTVISEGVELTVIEITSDGITVEAVHPEQGWRFEAQVPVKRDFK